MGGKQFPPLLFGGYMKIKATFPKRRDGGFGSVTIVGANGKPVVLAIGADGIVDVPDEHAARLINLGNFISANGSQPKVDQNEDMLITNGDETIDLMTLDKKALLELANGVMGLGMHPKCGEAKLRDAIYQHVNGN